jgi:oligopeptide transport system ATP-binding protein
MSEAVLQPLLRVRNLCTHFETDDGMVRAVDGVSFDVAHGEVRGIVGESGSGKSVTALSIMRLVPSPPAQISADELSFAGRDILRMSDAEARRLRGPAVAMVFQDPMKSLNPVLTIGRQITEALREHLRMDASAARARAIKLLEMVGIPSPERRLQDYPHQFSGGMRQRVMIAVALSCNPKLLIADEATTALDVTIQAQIIDVVKRLTRELGTAVIWISHDLGVVAGLCDRVDVMYAGRIVESGSVRDLFHRPSHGYTLGLLGSTPRLDDAEGRRLVPIDGQPPSLLHPIRLCPFLPRCAYAEDPCRREAPRAREIGRGHSARCWVDLRRYWRGQAA